MELEALCCTKEKKNNNIVTTSKNIQFTEKTDKVGVDGFLAPP